LRFKKKEEEMLLNPMPYMENQILYYGGIDLNCGWYCAKAMLGYWYQKQHGQLPRKVLLPAARTAYGYDPKEDALDFWASTIRSRPVLPYSAAEWEDLLGSNGPVMARGKLGGADWGQIGSKKMGIGHWILIVGVDDTANTLSYKDPLQGNKLRTRDFAQTNDRIGAIRYLDQAGATKVLTDSQRTSAPRPTLGTIRRPPPAWAPRR
jgi:hypothetical protein